MKNKKIILSKYFILIILIFEGFLFFGSQKAKATNVVKVLNDSRHAYGGITSTIDQLLGPGHVGTDIIVDSTNMGGSGPLSTDVSKALDTTATYYDQNGNPVASRAPYQIFSTSGTLYSGDNDSEYNLTSTNDVVHNYAYSAALPAGTPPPAFHVAPGQSSYGSGPGVEWTLDCGIFDCSSLSSLTADNAGIMAVLRYNHPTWNQFDVKAALRQTGSNWATGYNPNSFGFGQVNYATANALTDNQIALQPPVASGSINSGLITFHIYPFKQTRRVKDVLFQFPSTPSFHGAELTLAQIQALGGTKVSEYSGTNSTNVQPLGNTAVNNAYFVWFTADNSTDGSAHFSRIDTYSVLGPFSQSATQIGGAYTSITDLGSTGGGVAIDNADKKLYFMDEKNETVGRIDLGTGTSTFGANEVLLPTLNQPFKEVLDGVHNKIYIVESGKSDIVVMDSGTGGTTLGANWQTFGSYGTGIGKFNGDSGIFVDSANNKLYIVDQGNSRVVKMDSGTGGTTLGANWQTFGSVGSGTGKSNGVDDIFVETSSNKIYLTDGGNNKIEKMDSGGGSTTLGNNWQTYSDPNFTDPIGITVDSAHNKVFVSDITNGVIEADSGGGSTTFGNNSQSFMGTLGAASGIAVDGASNKLYVFDSNNSDIAKMDSGTGGTTLGNNFQTFDNTTNPGDGSGFSSSGQSNNLFLDSANNKIYIGDDSNNRMIRIDSGGGSTTLGGNFAKFPSASIANPYGMALDSQHNKLYVTDPGSNDIVIMDSGGGGTTLGANWQTFGSQGSGTGQFLTPNGIFVDSANNKLYIADQNNNDVIKMDSGTGGTTLGANWQTFGTVGSGTGQFHQPNGIYVDTTNNKIYVADKVNYRIEKMDSGGGGTTLGANWQTFGTNGTGSGQFSQLGYIFVDTANNKIYATDSSNKHVDIMDSGSGGTTLGGNWQSIGVNGNGTQDGQLGFPTGIWVDTANNVIYVYDSVNNGTSVGRIVQIIPPVNMITQNNQTIENQVINCTANGKNSLGLYVQAGITGTKLDNDTFLNCGINAMMLRSSLSEAKDLLFVNNGSAVSDQAGGYTCTNCFDDATSGNANASTIGQLNYNSPAIDAGTSITGRTTDASGNPIYGTPDIGGYEYQPPHVMGTDKIDIGAGGRIYGDGKFRDLGTTNSNLASLTVTPQGGTFSQTTSPIPAWLDITNIANWTNDHKTWTESNAETSNMQTDHTVGDLENNKWYDMKIDGTSASGKITGINGTTCQAYGSFYACQSDSNGKIYFNYTGGYSTHTFDIQKDTTPPTLSNPQSIGIVNINNPSFTFDSTEAGTITYDGGCTSSTTNAVVNQNLITFNPLSDGTYSSCRLSVTDIDGNTSAWLNIPSFTVNTNPPVLSNGSPSGDLPSDTTQTTISVITNEDSACRFSTIPGTDYASMDPNSFDTTGNTTHTKTISGLSAGTEYRYYVKCEDLAGNITPNDYTIDFSIASPPAATSNTQSSSHHSSHHKKKSKPKRQIHNQGSTYVFHNGNTITPAGSNFSKNSPVAIYFSKSNGVFYLYKRITTDSKGNFSISLTINKPAGFYGWYAVDQKTGHTSKTVHYTVR
jgi:DNA-binding beta-propeller fold protein YncE